MISRLVAGDSVVDKLNEVVDAVNASVSLPGVSSLEQEWAPGDPNTNADKDH